MPNALAASLARVRAAGTPLLDLTATNPTAVGLVFEPGVLSPLAAAAGERYAPEPFGLASAREAVASEYGRANGAVDPSRIVLTSSTSEAYGLLFKLLCDPGADVLVPQPSYPLFDLLTRLDAVAAQPYDLDAHANWRLDRGSIERARSGRTRAILAVSPNNPTGSILERDDLDWLDEFAAHHDLALIVDEVFAEFPLAARPAATRALARAPRALTFVLGGLSKSAGLPQVKLGWMIAAGPDARVEQALARLEMICDSYLSVSTPVQVAAPALLAAGDSRRARIMARLRTNLAELGRVVARHPEVSFSEPDGGWSAVVQVPSIRSEEALVLTLLERAHVLLHPGFFFDFPREAFLVVSLLPEPAVFAEGIGRALTLACASD